MAAIGDRIRELRERKGFSQRELAARCGVARNTIVRTETGETVPSSALIVKVARALGVEPGELFETPSPLVEEDLLSRPEVQAWLAEQGHKGEEEFLAGARELESLEAIEDALDEIHALRERLLEDLDKTSVRNMLFTRRQGLPSQEGRLQEALQPAKLAWRLKHEIRHEYLVRETALSNYSRRLFVEGLAEDYLTRVRDPRQHGRMLRARRRLLEESYAAAAAAG